MLEVDADLIAAALKTAMRRHYHPALAEGFEILFAVVLHDQFDVKPLSNFFRHQFIERYCIGTAICPIYHGNQIFLPETEQVPYLQPVPGESFSMSSDNSFLISATLSSRLNLLLIKSRYASES